MLNIFIRKSYFFSSYKKFLVVENSFPTIEKLDISKTRKKVKHISTYDFSNLYTPIPHNLLIKVFSDIIHFVFKSKVRSKIGFSPASIYWTSKSLGKGSLRKKSYWGSYTLKQKLVFYYQKFGVQTRYWRWIFVYNQILKSFQRYSDVLKKSGKNFIELIQELKSYLSSE